MHELDYLEAGWLEWIHQDFEGFPEPVNPDKLAQIAGDIPGEGFSKMEAADMEEHLD